jgi:curved DNA-binding protein CbpA
MEAVAPFFAMRPSHANTLYEILEVDKHASAEEIAEAFRKQVRIWHPDKNVHNPEDTNAEFKILMNAFDILSHPFKRTNYDRFQFDKAVRPKADPRKDEKIVKFRAEQRININRELNKNNRDHRVFEILSKASLFGIVAACGIFVGSFFFGIRGADKERPVSYSSSLALIALNGSLIGYMIFGYEMSAIKKKNFDLAIRLYSYIDR